MKNSPLQRTLFAFTLVGTMGASAAAYADRNEGLYVGARLGTPDVDIDASEFDADIDENETLGLVLGAGLGNGWAIEYEHLEFDGDFEVDDNDGSYDADSNALYGVWRSPGQVYFKARAGVARTSVEGRSAAARASDGDTDLSGGIGAGIDLSPVTIEADYTYVNEDINNFGIGINVHF